MGEYKLSASLEEHEDDVRSVLFPRPGFLLSASRDATVRVWKLLSDSPPKYDATISSHGSSFINAVTYLPPNSNFANGLIVSGGKDSIVEVRKPEVSHEENAEALLLGHAHNVCALDASPEGGYIASGSWDNTGRIWKIGKWECEAVLEGHGGSVWTVLAFDSKTVITGCADKLIRIFDLHGKLGKTISGSADVVRALCRVTKGHLSGADFASAGNDGMIRLWSLQGKQLGQLQGHDSFIYSLVSLSTGELASSGEDRTVRIWRGNDCVQTITHPAISVWTIGACAENGDLVSGASDRVVRVFTRDNKRQAEPSAIAAFEDSVKSSSIPQQQVGSINREKLPGPEFLQQRSGTKEGQVQMIQESNGSVSAHQWSQASQSWTNVGTVVDAAGSSGRKTTYGGKDYDYVFDVDIEDGKPALKLPYNLSQNPYEAATKFIQDNELPMSYLDEVANFITKNTQGASLGGQAQGGSDPWGSDARYRPDETQQPSISTPSSGARPKKIPQTTYLSMKNANFGNILKKVTDLNQQLVDEGSADVALSNELLMTLKSTSKPLEDFLSEKSDTCPDLTEPLSVVLHMISTWPDSSRLPALDLLRLFTAASSVVAEYHPPGSNATIVQFLATNAFQDKDRVNNLMLAVRTFSNLFETELGLSLADKEFEQIHSLVKATMESPGYSTNENLAIAITTVDLNYAVLFTSSVAYKALPSSLDRALELLDELVAIINQAGYSEAVYRALVATRILLSLGEEVEEAARQIYDLESALKKAESKYEETRILGAILEIRGLLKS